LAGAGSANQARRWPDNLSAEQQQRDGALDQAVPGQGGIAGGGFLGLLYLPALTCEFFFQLAGAGLQLSDLAIALLQAWSQGCGPFDKTSEVNLSELVTATLGR
jgi:hypothetical protein